MQQREKERERERSYVVLRRGVNLKMLDPVPLRINVWSPKN